jgi:hypothetical protein
MLAAWEEEMTVLDTAADGIICGVGGSMYHNKGGRLCVQVAKALVAEGAGCEEPKWVPSP